MSVLADRINRASRVDAGRIGFGPAVPPRETPTLLCLLRLDKARATKAARSAAADSDAVVITGLEPDKLEAVIKTLDDVPVGIRLENGDRAAVAGARTGGADFVVLDTGASAEASLEEGVGFVLGVGADIGDAELRALAGLPLDALEVPAPGERLTMGGMIGLRRLSLLSQTPLLVEVHPDVDASRLQALREAGVVGVIVDGKHAESLPALRRAVLSLPPRGRRREERAEAILPPLMGVAVAEEDEEPEYE